VAGAKDSAVVPEAEENPVLKTLRELNPDSLTPREALELLYQLRRKLDE
jgi:DNA mismatch repair ATPase MutS